MEHKRHSHIIGIVDEMRQQLLNLYKLLGQDDLYNKLGHKVANNLLLIEVLYVFVCECNLAFTFRMLAWQKTNNKVGIIFSVALIFTSYNNLSNIQNWVLVSTLDKCDIFWQYIFIKGNIVHDRDEIKRFIFFNTE